MAKAVAQPGYGLPGGGYGFWLTPDQVEPVEDPAWGLAPDPLKKAFWKEASRVGQELWDRSRARGLDRWGQPLAAISPLTAQARDDNINSVTGKKPYSPMGRANSSNKPLTPVGEKSRARSLLRAQAFPGRGVWFYWLFDFNSRIYWGAAMERHAQGFRKYFRYPRHGWGHVPSRDIVGFSGAEVAAVARAMKSWWSARRGSVVKEAGQIDVSLDRGGEGFVLAIPDGARILPRDQRARPAWAQGRRDNVIRISEKSALGFEGQDRGAGRLGFQTRPSGKVATAPQGSPDPSRLLTESVRARRPLYSPPQAREAFTTRTYEYVYLKALDEWKAMAEGEAKDTFWKEKVAPALLAWKRELRRRGA
jgi:hypothetical protein